MSGAYFMWLKVECSLCYTETLAPFVSLSYYPKVIPLFYSHSISVSLLQ